MNKKTRLGKDDRKSKARLSEELRSAKRKIAALKRAKDALKVDEELYRLIFENSGEAILLTQLDGTIYAANPEACRMFGRSEKEIKKIGRAGITDSKDPRISAAIKKAHRKGRFKGELNHVRKDGTVFPCEVTTTIFKDSSGNERTVVMLRDLTERKRAEEMLRESEGKLKTVFEILPIGISILDAKRKIVYCNPALETILNIPLEKLLCGDFGRRTYFRHDETPMPAEEFASVRAIKEQRQICDVETGIKKEDGKVIWANVSAVPVAFKDWKVVVITSDITERKRAEQAQALQLAMLDATPGFVGFADARDTHIIYINPAGRKMIGVESQEDVTQIKIADVHPEWTNKLFRDESFPAAIRDGIWTGECAFLHRDGREIPVMMELLAHKSPSGEVERFSTISIDITERKRMEEALRKSEGKYRSLTGNINLGIYRNTVGPEGKFIEANPAIIGMFGYKSKEEFLAMKVSDLYRNPKERKMFNDKMFKDGFTKGEELWLKKKDGSLFIASVSAVSVKDEQGHVKYYDGIIDNIAERKRAEAKLRQSHRELRALSTCLQALREEDRTELAREIHDELGQALTALKMDLSWLAKRLPKKPPTLLKKTADMSAITDATLGTVRQIATRLRPALLDDLGLITAMEWQADEFRKRTGINLQFSCKPKRLILDADRSTAFFRIFQELLTNVARHAEATNVVISFRKRAESCEMIVKDDGRGIEKKAAAGSQSLGLIGIRERAYTFGGTVEIRGIRGRGTTVIVRLPAERSGK